MQAGRGYVRKGRLHGLPAIMPGKATMNKKERLDIPGFRYGIKTGECIDVPRALGGRPTPKRSGKPHGINELITGEVVSRARKGKLLATRIAKEDYSKRKRQKTRAEHRPIAADPVRPCNRRYFELMGMKASFLAYSEAPELFISKAKKAYELTDGLLPFLTVTSAREALIICASLAKFRIAAYFNEVKVPRL